jgi:hypothetical protein
MASLSHESRFGGAWTEYAAAWESLAITSMWVAVVLVSIFGPAIESSSPGGSTTSVPSGVLVGLFAVLGSYFVAKYGLGGRRRAPQA